MEAHRAIRMAAHELLHQRVFAAAHVVGGFIPMLAVTVAYVACARWLKIERA